MVESMRARTAGSGNLGESRDNERVDALGNAQRPVNADASSWTANHDHAKFLNARIRDQVLTSAEPLYVAA